MRKLMWFTVGFAGAGTVAAYLLHGRGLLLLSAVMVVCVLILLAFSNSKFRVAMLICLGCAVSFAWMWMFDTLYLSDIRQLDNTKTEISVVISDYSQKTDYGLCAEGTTRINGKQYRIRVYSYDLEELKPGDLVAGECRLRFTVGQDQMSNYHSSEGVYLLGYLDEASVSFSDKVALKHYPSILRKQILQLLEQLMPEDTRAFAKALLLGDRSELDYQTNTDLAVSGIRHVVAVSGLHVSIICSLVYAVFGHRRVATPLIGWSLLLLFAGVTGFTPSVVRSCVMYALMFGSLAAQKEYDAPTALAFAVLTMLFVNPMAITSISLQLSAACVIGIFLFSTSIRDFLLSDKVLGKHPVKSLKGKLTRWVADSVSITLSTMITTTPLCAIYFGTISLVGILTNLLTLWVVTIIFSCLLAAIAVGAIYLPLGQGIGWLVSWAVRYVLYVARLLASFPLAAVYTASPYIVMWIVFAYVLLFAFLLVGKKYPWLMASCLAAGLCFAVAASWLDPRLDGFRFTVLDVGQGQCILLQNKDSHYMIDCGGDSGVMAADMAAKTLLSQGITHLDGLILTHYDEDHSSGVLHLLSRVPADTLYLPDLDENSPIRGELTSTYGDRVCWIRPDTTTQIPQLNATVISGSEERSDNESSLCVLFQPENCDILICGDRGTSGERDLLEQVTLPQVDVLVVGHHGAKDAAGLELLNAVRPDTAIISVGKTNSYGHPSEDVLQRLALFDCDILRTDIHGKILVRG